MEAEEDDDSGNNKDGHPLHHHHQHHHHSKSKRKVESSFGLFCVMRKRARVDNISIDDDDDYMSPSSDFEYEEKGDDFFCSDSDTDLSECSEFDVISQHVVQDKGLVGSEDGGNEVRSCDEPRPISSSVPHDGGSSGILLDTCSFQQIGPGTGISPMPLTKTLEGPGRQWSVCGSVASGRNIHLVGDSSGGACNTSLGEQLDVNVSSFQGMDAGLSRTLYQEEDEDEDEDEMSFSEVDAMIRRLNLIPDDSDSCLDMEERNMSEHPRQTLLGLEHCSIPRGIISQGAIAVLHCRGLKHCIRKQEVIIGRSCDGMNVDIDLSKYGYGSNISRRQALVKLENNGSFSLKNLGKRHILVNGEKLNTGQAVPLASCSSVDIRGEVFVFKINKEAVRQFLKNNSTRRNSKDDTKFRWCE